jgi:hypothetical protein
LPEWLIERGIGESRAIRIRDGEIAEARIILDGVVRTGTIMPARLIAAAPRAIAEAGGQEYLLPKGAPRVTDGAEIMIEVTREAIPGAEPWKRPLARVVDDSPRGAPPLHANELPFPASADKLGGAGWDDLIEEARTGTVSFAGGELRISPTAAMTLIDVDGYLPADELAVLGAEQAARAILRLDIGGSIGIDVPTGSGKAARPRAAEAIDAVLPKPFERAAVNGFGFVQLVRQRRRASLVELAQDRAAFEARALLRRTAFEAGGPKRLVVHPAVGAVLDNRRDWLDLLAHQVGGAVSLRLDAALPISGGYVEPA